MNTRNNKANPIYRYNALAQGGTQFTTTQDATTITMHWNNSAGDKRNITLQCHAYKIRPYAVDNWNRATVSSSATVIWNLTALKNKSAILAQNLMQHTIETVFELEGAVDTLAYAWRVLYTERNAYYQRKLAQFTIELEARHIPTQEQLVALAMFQRFYAPDFLDSFHGGSRQLRRIMQYRMPADMQATAQDLLHLLDCDGADLQQAARYFAVQELAATLVSKLATNKTETRKA